VVLLTLLVNFEDLDLITLQRKLHILQTDKPIPIPDKELKSGCGHRNAKGVGGIRVTGALDGESEFGEFPWTVMIFFNKTVKGGTL
jgi:hypothetical protein